MLFVPPSADIPDHAVLDFEQHESGNFLKFFELATPL
jgi:hypothetical protein